MTGLDPDVRFDKHKAGIQANRYVQEYGQRLLPEIYELYNPLTCDEARSFEVELGIDLREGGFGAWQASCWFAFKGPLHTVLNSQTHC